MNEQDLFILADTTLLGVITQIRSDQWGMTMPSDFPTWDPNATMTLRQVVNYHGYDDAWVLDTLAGKTIEEVGSAHDGDLLGDDPKRSFARFVDAAVAAVRDLDDLDRVVHLAYGDLPAREYLWHITSFRGLRVHDIAKAIGVDSNLPSDLTQGLWDQIAPTPKNGAPSASSAPKSTCPPMRPSRTASSASPAASRSPTTCRTPRIAAFSAGLQPRATRRRGSPSPLSAREAPQRPAQARTVRKLRPPRGGD